MSTSDIVERLRGFAASWHRCKSGPAGWLKFPEHYEEAAAEIERLRAENERLRAMVPITNVHDMSHVHEVDPNPTPHHYRSTAP